MSSLRSYSSQTFKVIPLSVFLPSEAQELHFKFKDILFPVNDWRGHISVELKSIPTMFGKNEDLSYNNFGMRFK